MIVDRKEHKQILIEMFDSTTFPGKFIELASELKLAIQNAQISEQVKVEKKSHPSSKKVQEIK